ncbi:MAG: alcohol dehydrogenase catalytic domain-containing protein [Alphaproteobacteria bacterium]|nr:alcohol dehydrogenase catalytic domain-containing protein [Alphaproteobacteria bacterium]
MLSQAIVAFGSPLQEIDVPTPEPRGSEVLVKVEHCGVCHSDVHIQDGYFDLGAGERLNLASLPLPHVMGHEIEGEVMAHGPTARGVKVGDRRAVYPWIGCGECAVCWRGEENLCSNPRQLGCSPGVHGGYSSHVLVPHPKYLLDYGAASPALAATYMCSGLTAYSAMRKVGTPVAGDEILIIGCGGVGLMGIEFAKAMFRKPPIATDIDEDRLDAATRAGAAAVYDTHATEAARKIVADTRGGVFAVVDFVGTEESFAFASAAVRKGGKIIVVGLLGGALAMPLPMLPLRALTIMGSFVGTLAEAEDMMALVRARQIEPIPLATRPLAMASRTLDDLRQGKIIGRVVLKP